MKDGPKRAPFQLRWVLGSPLLLAACFAATGASLVLGRAMGALHEARAIRRGLEEAAARLAAEQAAIDYVGSQGNRTERSVDAGSGIEVRASVSSDPATGALALAADVGGRQLSFSCPLLPGATPAVFGLDFVTVVGAPELPAHWPHPAVVQRSDLPQLDPAKVERGRDPVRALLRRDAGIALLRLPAGTDREDYVFASPCVRPVHCGVLTVPGNLWLDAGSVPLQFVLDEDLTIAVVGNAYLGRSVRVDGPGRLTIVTVIDEGVAFADNDGNGRWSPGDVARGPRFEGPMEGAGTVWLGLPREVGTKLDLELGLVVGGELMCAAEATRVGGTVVLGQGGTLLAGRRGDLKVVGRHDPRGERALLPGFAAVGDPRPGCLKQMDRQQPLYLAAPVR